MFRSGLKTELWRCFGVLSLFALIGLISGHFTATLCVGLGSYLIWLFAQIVKLEEWINRSRRSGPPPEGELQGLWKDIGYDVQLMAARHEKEKQRLQAVVKRVQEMATALTDAVVLIDPRGNMEWWNSAAQALFNFHSMDAGHKLSNLIRHPEFIQYFDKRQYQTPLELTMWRKDQHLEFQVHTFGEGERLVIARDITRLFKLEQMRKDFVANVSHELRTPLTVIRGYIETLADSPNAPAPWRKAFAQMEQQAHRMTLLINDLITLSKLETDQKEMPKSPVSVANLVAGIVADAKTMSADRQHIFAVNGDDALALIGSERELRSAVSNLVINAINYSEPGASIGITYSSTTNGAIISVKDSGLGIEPKHIPRLTERFYRVDAGRSVASGGTGLGLAIVKHVLLRHNAELRIQSQLGRGSQFSCHFPQSMVTQLNPTNSNNQ